MYDVALIAFKLSGSQATLPGAAGHHVTCKRESTASLNVSNIGQIWVAVLYDCMCRVAQVLAEHMNVPVVKSDMILEGGSVHTDGEG